MKPERTRLAELRKLSYEHYLETPEWQATAKAALKRAGKRCQGCQAVSVALGVYHTTIARLGCEQEEDVVVLCDACFETLSTPGKRALQEAGQNAEDRGVTSSPQFSFGKKMAIFFPSALIGLGLPALAHAPLPAEVFGLIAAFALAANSPKIYAEMKGSLPQPLADLLERGEKRRQERAGRGEWSQWDRLRGLHLQGNRRASTVPSKTAEKEHAPTHTEQQQEERRQRVAAPADRIAFGEIIAKAKRFDPPLNSILGKGVLLAGSQGTGKSNIIGLIVQAAGTCGTSGMPVVVIDFKGEFHTLTEVVFNGILAGAPSFAKEMGSGYYPLSVHTAPELADIIMEGPLQVVVDIPSYNGDGDVVAEVVSTLLRSLVTWGMKKRRQGIEPWPCLVITDEAHNFLPERQNLSGFAMRNGKESFGLLTSAYSAVGNAGRSFGYTVVLATQRLPNIAKWSIANLQKKVILAHAEKNDLNACEVETDGQVSREQIKALAPGTGIVVGYGDPFVVSFDKQKARHVSTTPQVERLHEQFRGQAPRRLSQMLVARKTSEIEAAPLPTKPAAPDRGRASLMPEQRVAPAPVTSEPAANRPSLKGASRISVQTAYTVYHSGYGYRGLARALDTTPETAAGLYRDLRRMGLIDVRGKKIEGQQGGVRQPMRQATSAHGPAQPTPEPQAQRPLPADLPEELRRALEAYYRGGTSKRTLADVLGIGPTKAGELLRDLEARGLIQRRNW